MNNNIPFQTIDWSVVPKTEHKGETGIAYWQTFQFDEVNPKTSIDQIRKIIKIYIFTSKILLAELSPESKKS